MLSLTASASVEVTKDVLAVTFSTTKEGADANVVQAQLKQALDAALAEAKKAARPGQVDVQTGAFSLFPRYTQQGRHHRLAGHGRDHRRRPRHGGDRPAQRPDHDHDGGPGRLPARRARPAQKVEADVAAEAIARYRAKAGEYAKQFGYAGYSIREVNVTTTEPPQGPTPMYRAQASAMAAQGDALSVEPGKAQVNANVSGTVQMK